jgi:hypothetical protein
VISDDGMNHQLFAFCPLTNRQMCGIGDDPNNNNMIIYAKEAK